ncbi:MAG: hypothetical protein AAFU80_16865 [Pseudomonadota bacterium]
MPRIKAAVCRTHSARLAIEQVDLAGPEPGEVRVGPEAVADAKAGHARRNVIIFD